MSGVIAGENPLLAALQPQKQGDGVSNVAADLMPVKQSSSGSTKAVTKDAKGGVDQLGS